MKGFFIFKTIFETKIILLIFFIIILDFLDIILIIL